MRRSGLLFPVVLSCMGTLLSPLTKADPVYESTKVTFQGPVEIPGMVLTPGTYVIKLLDPYGDRDIVRFYNADESHMYKMVFAVRDYRLTPADHAVITFEERAAGAPPAIKDWFPPGENWGEQFVYPKVKTIAAEAVSQSVASPPAPAAAAPPPTAAPAPVAQAQPKPAAAQIAQAQPEPARVQPALASPAATPQPKNELPKTAGDLPIVALIGGLLVLAGAIGRRAS